MEDKYKVINEYLNNYALAKNNTFFYNNLIQINELANMLILKNEKLDTKTNISFKCNTFLDGFTSIEIVRNYLKTLDNNYVILFDTYLKNGTINFTDLDDNNLYDDKNSYTGKIKESGQNTINIALEHTYVDPKTIIHEFFHILNLKDNYKGDSRSTLTELISIYFENECLDYMERLGYDSKEITKVRIGRMYDTYNCSIDIRELSDLFIIYENFGNLNENTYDLKEKYKEYFPFDKTYYIKLINNLYDKIKSKNMPNLVYMSRYLFCDNIANYLRLNKKEDTTDKVMKLNQLIINNPNIFECLKYIGFPIDDPDISEKAINATVTNLNNNFEILKRSQKNQK